MRVLVTGSAGFLGSCFCRHILEEHPEIEVLGIDNYCTGFQENCDPRMKTLDIDLIDHVAVDSVFRENSIDYIVHMAAFAAEALSDLVRRHTYMNNVVASANLINSAINYGIKRFLFTSSIASYGDLRPPFKETMSPRPMDVYGLSKHVTSEDLRIANEHHGLEFVVVKPFNVYGPGQALNSRYRNVAGIFMNKLLDGLPLTVYGSGMQKRAFTYIDDILRPLWKALTEPKCANQTYNLGSSRFSTVNEFAQAFLRVAGRGEIQHLEKRHEVQQAWCDVSKAQRELGLEEETSLEDGLRKMWIWAQTQPRRPVETFKAIEVQKGLYSFWT